MKRLVTEFSFECEVNRTEMFHNGNGVEIEVRFQRKIDIKFNNIKMIVCQMINYIIFKIFRCYIAVLIDGMNR